MRYKRWCSGLFAATDEAGQTPGADEAGQTPGVLVREGAQREWTQGWWKGIASQERVEGQSE